jgi:glycosyltransferase involved in cell wall biosynthesis
VFGMMRLGTILIPAWNEAAVIGQSLARLEAEGVTRFFEVIVIANGCHDDTAVRAQAAMPEVRVIETPVAGKTHALNLGQTQALRGLPLICLDCDLGTGLADLIALTVPLHEGGAEATCGTMEVDAAGANAVVRAWYRAWLLNPYFAHGKFGGLFALSPSAVDRLFPLPDVVADDEYLRRSFAPGQIAYVPTSRFTAKAPRDLASLMRVRTRSLRGSRALGRNSEPDGARRMLQAAFRKPARWGDMVVFAAVQLAVRLNLARAKAPRWERDNSTRTEA